MSTIGTDTTTMGAGPAATGLADGRIDESSPEGSGLGGAEAWLVAISEKARATRDLAGARDLALLAARVGLAWIFIYHGAVTLFGAFGGGGIHAQTEFFSSVAHLQPAMFFAVLSGIIEFFGGIAVGLGIFGRLAALGLVGDMAMAMATVTFGNGIVSNAPGSGYELNVALAMLAVVVVLMGTGRFSLDELLRTQYRRWRHLS